MPKEKILYQESPSQLILVIWFLLSMVYALIPTFLLGGLTITFFPLITLQHTLTWFLTIFIISLTIIFLYHIALRKTYKYYITDQKIAFEGGILVKKWKNVPYHKVTDVVISQNIIEKLLGIFKFNIHTPGTGLTTPEISFVGICDPEKPKRIVLEILQKYKATGE